MKSQFVIGNLSDVGRVRQVNEDYYGSFSGSYGQIIIVCDGMGGHKGGFQASHLAVEAIKEHFMGVEKKFEPREELLKCLQKANAAIRESAQQNPELEGMGATVVIVLLTEDQIYYAHAGDSRIYMIRDNNIHQLTKDHSLIQQLLDAGIVKPENAATHPNRNVINKALGNKPEILPDVAGPEQIFKEDKYLLCSDGLTGFVTDEVIRKIALENEPQEACKKLVNLANENGGKDNITVQIISVVKGKGKPVTLPPVKHLILYGIISLVLIAAALNFVGPAKGYANSIISKISPSEKPKPIADSTNNKPLIDDGKRVKKTEKDSVDNNQETADSIKLLNIKKKEDARSKNSPPATQNKQIPNKSADIPKDTKNVKPDNSNPVNNK